MPGPTPRRSIAPTASRPSRDRRQVSRRAAERRSRRCQARWRRPAPGTPAGCRLRQQESAEGGGEGADPEGGGELDAVKQAVVGWAGIGGGQRVGHRLRRRPRRSRKPRASPMAGHCPGEAPARQGWGSASAASTRNSRSRCRRSASSPPRRCAIIPATSTADMTYEPGRSRGGSAARCSGNEGEKAAVDEPGRDQREQQPAQRTVAPKIAQGVPQPVPGGAPAGPARGGRPVPAGAAPRFRDACRRAGASRAGNVAAINAQPNDSSAGGQKSDAPAEGRGEEGAQAGASASPRLPPGPVDADGAAAFARGHPARQQGQAAGVVDAGADPQPDQPDAPGSQNWAPRRQQQGEATAARAATSMRREPKRSARNPAGIAARPYTRYMALATARTCSSETR